MAVTPDLLRGPASFSDVNKISGIPGQQAWENAGEATMVITARLASSSSRAQVFAVHHARYSAMGVGTELVPSRIASSSSRYANNWRTRN